jgi:hypothetical protein
VFVQMSNKREGLLFGLHREQAFLVLYEVLHLRIAYGER